MAILLAVAAWLSPSRDVLAQNGRNDAGRVLYAQGCASCHGVNARGNEALAAPALAGQDRVYTARQLANFAQQHRGGRTSDRYGSQMTLFAQLLGEEDRERLAAYVASLPAHAPSATIRGNSARGRELFETCASCHGSSGEGGDGPRLDTLADWYVVTQMRNYATGARGYRTDNADDQTMAALARDIDETDARDIAAYLNSLRGAGSE
jgi:cytochrome c oxidase subunit 2